MTQQVTVSFDPCALLGITMALFTIAVGVWWVAGAIVGIQKELEKRNSQP